MRKKLLISTILTGFMVTGLAQSTWASDLPSDNDLLSGLSSYEEGPGTKFPMRLQDSSVDGVSNTEIYFTNKVTSGPSDLQFIYSDDSRDAFREDGDYTIYSLKKNRLTKADSASMYANLRYTSNLLQGDLSSLIRSYPGDQKVRIAAHNYALNTTNVTDTGSALYYFPKGKEMENAYYSRFVGDDGYTYRLMVMGYYTADGKTHYTAQQPDIIFHEFGHAGLDGMRPDLFNDSTQAGAFHEAWGDTNAFFTALSFGELRQQVLADTGGNLHQPNFIAHMAERFGSTVLGEENGLRDMDDDLRIDEVSSEVHDLSRVLAGAIYDINAKAYNDLVRTRGQPAETLGLVSGHLRQEWVYTTTQVSETPSFTEIGTILRDSLSQSTFIQGGSLSWQSYVEEEFKKRGVVLDGTPDPWNWKNIKGKNWLSAHGGRANHAEDIEIVKEFSRGQK